MLHIWQLCVLSWTINGHAWFEALRAIRSAFRIIQSIQHLNLVFYLNPSNQSSPLVNGAMRGGMINPS